MSPRPRPPCRIGGWPHRATAPRGWMPPPRAKAARQAAKRRAPGTRRRARRAPETPTAARGSSARGALLSARAFAVRRFVSVLRPGPMHPGERRHAAAMHPPPAVADSLAGAFGAQLEPPGLLTARTTYCRPTISSARKSPRCRLPYPSPRRKRRLEALGGCQRVVKTQAPQRAKRIGHGVGNLPKGPGDGDVGVLLARHLASRDDHVRDVRARAGHHGAVVSARGDAVDHHRVAWLQAGRVGSDSDRGGPSRARCGAPAT